MGAGPIQDLSGTVDDVLERTRREYAGDEDRPLGSYAALMAAYLTATAAAVTVLRRRGHRFPVRLDPGDLALLAVATHRLTRTLAKDPVASPIRAPFTRYAGLSGPAELHEEVRGSGVRKAVGELLTCPFCMAQWTATAFTLGLVAAPRATRFAAGVLTTVAGADALQLLYTIAERRAMGED